MKDAFVKIRISDAEKSRLVRFAGQSGKSASEIVRSALDETMRGQIAGDKRRKDIATLRRSTNLMLEAFAEKPIDVCWFPRRTEPVRRTGGADEHLDHQEVVHVFLRRQTSSR